MDISTHEEHVAQPLQTKKRQFEIAVDFLTYYNGLLKAKFTKTLNFISEYQLTMMSLRLLSFPTLQVNLRAQMMKLKEFLLKKAILHDQNTNL